MFSLPTIGANRLRAGGGDLIYVGGKTHTEGGSTTDAVVSLTDLTGGTASSPSEGDFIIISVGWSGESDDAPGVVTAGYTELVELFGSDQYKANLSVSYKFLGASETSVTVTATDNLSIGLAVAIHVWRGVDTSFPIDAPFTTATGFNSGQANPPAITPRTDGAVVIATGLGGGLSMTTAFTSSDLSNFVTAYADDVYDAAIGTGSIVWTSGAVDPAQFGGSTTASTAAWAAATLALRKAGTAGVDELVTRVSGAVLLKPDPAINRVTRMSGAVVVRPDTASDRVTRVSSAVILRAI